MKIKHLSPWFHDTARLLKLRLDDKDRRSPVYPGDGRLCIARLKKPSHVVHEFAHFVGAYSFRRRAPNYGLGTDPDNGPKTTYSDELDQASADLCEELCTFLTFMLLAEADLPWRREAPTEQWCDPRTEAQAEDQQARIELATHYFKARGIDIYDPLAHFRAGDPDR